MGCCNSKSNKVEDVNETDIEIIYGMNMKPFYNEREKSLQNRDNIGLIGINSIIELIRNVKPKIENTNTQSNSSVMDSSQGEEYIDYYNQYIVGSNNQLKSEELLYYNEEIYYNQSINSPIFYRDLSLEEQVNEYQIRLRFIF